MASTLIPGVSRRYQAIVRVLIVSASWHTVAMPVQKTIEGVAEVLVHVGAAKSHQIQEGG
jgi:hypothetical protein